MEKRIIDSTKVVRTGLVDVKEKDAGMGQMGEIRVDMF